VTILGRSSGSFNTTTAVTVTPSGAAFGTGTVIVVAIFGNTVFNTPGSATQRTNSVVNLGLYSYDIAGTGQTSIAFTATSAGSGQWFAWELTAGSTFLSGSATQNNVSASSFTPTAQTPTVGNRHMLAAIGGVGTSNVRSVTGVDNSFTLFGAAQVAAQDWPFSAGADRDVVGDGVTSYTTTGTFSAFAVTAAGGIILSYINASGGTAFTRTVDDSAGLADAATASSALARTVTDLAGLVENLARAQTATISDVAGLVDTAATAAVFARTASDDAGLTDSVAVQSASGLTRTIDDSAGLADALAFARTVSLADLAGSTDQLALGVAVTVTDSVGLADSATALAAGAGSRQVDDSAGLSDSVTYSSTQTLSDVLGLSDAVATAMVGARSVSDSVGLTDSVVVAIGRAITITDAAVLADSMTVDKATAGTQTRTITDSVGLDSTIGVVLTAVRPGSGATSRPGGGTTTRPLAGVTPRYPLVSD
jgi:hypothetical protein